MGVLRTSARATARRGAGERPGVRWNCQLSRPWRAPKNNEISQHIEYSGLWGAITTFPKRQPYMTNIIIATVKTSCADILVQLGEDKEHIDWKRSGVFTAFGFFYLGCCQWFIYVTVFSRLCPNAIRFANSPMSQKLKDRAGQIDLVKQTLLDNFGHYTFVYFPVFYTFKEFIQSGDNDGDDTSLFERALAKYQKNFIEDNLAIWALWIPMDIIIYACPIWMRMPLNHGVSLAWTMILSWMRGQEEPEGAPMKRCGSDYLKGGGGAQEVGAPMKRCGSDYLTGGASAR